MQPFLGSAADAVTVAGKAKKYPSHAGQRHGLGRFLEELSDEEVPLSSYPHFHVCSSEIFCVVKMSRTNEECNIPATPTLARTEILEYH